MAGPWSNQNSAYKRHCSSTVLNPRKIHRTQHTFTHRYSAGIASEGFSKILVGLVDSDSESSRLCGYLGEYTVHGILQDSVLRSVLLCYGKFFRPIIYICIDQHMGTRLYCFRCMTIWTPCTLTRSPDTRSSLDPMISQYSLFMIQKPVLVMSLITVYPTFQFISHSPNYACDPLGSCNRWQTGVKYDLPDPS